jgi:hypothetical protein
VEHAPHIETRLGALFQRFGAAIGALVRKSGNSLLHSPLPEIREAARDWSA